MSKSQLQKASDAHALYGQLIEIVKMKRLSGAMLGKVLWNLKANNSFKKAIGSGIDTWEDFLKMPEIGIDMREANRAMEIYEQFVVKLHYTEEELAEVGTKALHYVLPLVKSGELQEEHIRGLLSDGANLTQAAFKERLHDVTKGGGKTYEYLIMRKCKETGTMQKVRGVKSGQIIDALKTLYHIDITEQFVPEII